MSKYFIRGYLQGSSFVLGHQILLSSCELGTTEAIKWELLGNGSFVLQSSIRRKLENSIIETVKNPTLASIHLFSLQRKWESWAREPIRKRTERRDVSTLCRRKELSKLFYFLLWILPFGIIYRWILQLPKLFRKSFHWMQCYK